MISVNRSLRCTYQGDLGFKAPVDSVGIGGLEGLDSTVSAWSVPFEMITEAVRHETLRRIRVRMVVCWHRTIPIGSLCLLR